MDKLKNESGYTIVLTLMLIVLFTILGISMMNLTLSGSKKSESREANTQASDLSMKGLDYFVETIQYDVNAYLNVTGGKSITDYKNYFDLELAKYSCSQGTTLLEDTTTGEAVYCIEKIEPANAIDTLKHVTIYSKGTVDGKVKENRTVVQMGLNHPSKYAIQAYKTTNANAGDLHLYGGLKVVGDIYSDNNLVMSNNAPFKVAPVESVFPELTGLTDERALAITNGKTFYKENIFQQANVEKEISSITFNTSNISSDKLIDTHFTINPGLIIDSKRFARNSSNVKINETELLWQRNHSFISRFKPLPDVAVASQATGYRLNSNQNRVVNQLGISNAEEFNLDWVLLGENNFKSVAFPKDVTLQHGVGSTSSSIFQPSLNVSDYAYIGADLMIGNEVKTETDLSLEDYLYTNVLGLVNGLEALTNYETTVELNGTFYVNDDLYISGARLKGNATIFVRDKVEILFSEIDANINIVAGGNIAMRYISNNHNAYYDGSNTIFNGREYAISSKPQSKLKGFIHSNSGIEIIGTSSWLDFKGVLSAPHVKLTSIRGRAETNCPPLPYDDNEEMAHVSTASGTKYKSNCFEKKEKQYLDQVTFYKPLVSVIGIINLLHLKTTTPIEPRLTITHDPTVTEDFFDYIQVKALEPPSMLSRE